MGAYNYEQFDVERNGPRAIAEFARAQELWKERARAAARTRHSG